MRSFKYIVFQFVFLYLLSHEQSKPKQLNIHHVHVTTEKPGIHPCYVAACLGNVRRSRKQMAALMQIFNNLFKKMIKSIKFNFFLMKQFINKILSLYELGAFYP